VTAATNTFIFDGSRTGSGFSDFLLGLPSVTRSIVGDPYGNTRKFELAWFVQDDWQLNSRLTLNYGLRWEFYGRIRENVNKQSTWMQDCNCIRRAGEGISESMTDNDWNNFAPRFGFAFRPFSGGRTVIRGAAGMFYDSDMRHNFQFVTNPPFLVTREYRASSTALSLDNPFPANAENVTLTPNAIPQHYVDTYAQHWSLGLQREFGNRAMLDVSYVGTHALKAQQLRNLNQPVNGVRPFPGFGSILMTEQSGNSIYHSLQIRAERRLSEGLAFQTSYTWAHAIDNRPGQGGPRIQNNYNVRSERGDADFDVRHRWNFSGMIDLPIGRGRRFGGTWSRPVTTILGGWTLSAIAIIQGGRPFTVFLDQDISRTGGFRSDRPNLVPGISLVPADQGPNNWINRAAFTLPATGTFGTAGRNIGRGPQLHNLDLALSKSAVLRENIRIQVRGELFNAFNHPNFALPATSFDNPTFGTINATIAPERQIQVGIRIDY
jgi:hypothetical protein